MSGAQLEPEWRAARLGKLTASRFGDVLADSRTARYRNYLAEIVAEIEGVPDFEDDKPWFQHGRAWEPEARSLYEWERDVEVRQVGFISHPKLTYVGASPDGLIGDLGGLEIKSRKSLREHLKVVDKGLPSEHKPQVQGNLWVTGRQWWDFVSYYRTEDGRERRIHIVRVYRDEKYIERLETACAMFWQQVQAALQADFYRSALSG